MLCAKPNGFNCEENYGDEDCEQLNNTNFKNYGCKFIYGYETDYFQCANRMDKKDMLFGRPPISVKKIRKAIFYNTELLFDEFYIYCGKFNFTYEDFYQVRLEHGNEYCDLADGKRDTIQNIWSELILDFSFNMTKKMNEL